MTQPTPTSSRITAAEAGENLRYWKSRRAAATRPGDRAQAGALVLAWEYQLKVALGETKPS